MFQAYIWWNKTENDEVKMHLYEMFKIELLWTDTLRTSFWDVLRMYVLRMTFLQNFKNKHRLTFKCFTQHIWWVGSKIIQK